uniref:Peptidase metallopeptidase domain-containing protein n=1 Tax=Acrobeloides nanus TaxID=290746 RepID=A0A914CSP7_9BILA
MINRLENHGRKKRYVLHKYKWDRCHLTWAFRDPFLLFRTEKDYQIAKSIISNAIKTWEQDSGGILKFTNISPKNRNTWRNVRRFAQLDIIFAYYEHGDGEKFDGPGGLIAHTGYPIEGIIHFDASEKWSARRKDDDFLDLRYVALHEIGHALGLRHSTYKNAVMNPYYSNRPDGELKLSKDDIFGIQELYQNCQAVRKM